MYTVVVSHVHSFLWTMKYDRTRSGLCFSSTFVYFLHSLKCIYIYYIHLYLCFILFRFCVFWTQYALSLYTLIYIGITTNQCGKPNNKPSPILPCRGGKTCKNNPELGFIVGIATLSTYGFSKSWGRPKSDHVGLWWFGVPPWWRTPVYFNMLNHIMITEWHHMAVYLYLYSIVILCQQKHLRHYLRRTNWHRMIDNSHWHTWSPIHKMNWIYEH